MSGEITYPVEKYPEVQQWWFVYLALCQATVAAGRDGRQALTASLAVAASAAQIALESGGVPSAAIEPLLVELRSGGALGSTENMIATAQKALHAIHETDPTRLGLLSAAVAIVDFETVP